MPDIEAASVTWSSPAAIAGITAVIVTLTSSVISIMKQNALHKLNNSNLAALNQRLSDSYKLIGELRELLGRHEGQKPSVPE